jgi:hypothetical protein
VPGAAQAGGTGAEEPPFRFEIGQAVQVLTHPARPLGTVVARWAGTALGDPHGENVYQLSSFVTKQRESSLGPADGAGRELQAE